VAETTVAKASSRELAKLAARTADEKKAQDVIVLDLTGLSDVCDYFVICTAPNNPLRDLVLEEVEAAAKKAWGISPMSVEGRAGDGWVLLDFGSVVVHVMRPEARSYYRLERLWGDAPRVRLGLESELDDGLGTDAAAAAERERAGEDTGEPDARRVAEALADESEREA
jgi:ribosome-associated protein